MHTANAKVQANSKKSEHHNHHTLKTKHPT